MSCAATGGQGGAWVHAAAEGHAWICDSIAIGVCEDVYDHVTTKGLVDALGLGHHLKSHWCLRVMLSPEPYLSEWPVLPPKAMLMSGPEV